MFVGIQYVFALGGALVFINAAYAQVYPAKPIRMVLPWPPGGSTDATARVLVPWLTKSLGQQIIIDNRAGAAGIIGVDIVAKASPDGYTIMLHSATHVANATIYSKLPYDTIKDFTAISLVAAQPTILVVNPALPIQSVKELIAMAKAEPGRLHYGSGGFGSALHMSAALFSKMAGVNIVHIPYKGGGPAVIALLGGEVQLLTATVPSVISLIKTGKLRALAVCSAKRSNLLPNLPTVAESGLPNYKMDSWVALFAPAGLSMSIVRRLHNEIERALNSPDVRDGLSQQGMEPMPSTQTEVAGFIQAELKKYADIIRGSEMRID
jgi:tripartite-type tricarboxylate transporter receptor subunit TctC